MPRSLSDILCVLVIVWCMCLPSDATLCGRRSSPAYHIADNIIVNNATDRDWEILRCFVSRMLKAELTGEELSQQPSLFLNCVLGAIGVRKEDRYDAFDVDNHIVQEREHQKQGLRPCIYQKLSCPEARNFVLCKQIVEKTQSFTDGAHSEDAVKSFHNNVL